MFELRCCEDMQSKCGERRENSEYYLDFMFSDMLQLWIGRQEQEKIKIENLQTLQPNRAGLVSLVVMIFPLD